MLAQGLTEPIGGDQRVRKLAQAHACLSAALHDNPTPVCDSFHRANWLEFYDPFTPLTVVLKSPK